MDINLITVINSLSYGIVGTNILDALTKAGNKVSLFPINSQNIEAHPKHHESIRVGLQNAQKFNPSNPCIRLWHQFDMSLFAGRGKHIGFPIFELDKFNEIENHHLSSCDELFSCSTWGKSIIDYNILNKNCYVIPLGVDSEIFYPKKSLRKSTVFLNCGKWEHRKGHDVLIEAFCRAFGPDDNVELWMMSHNTFLNDRERDVWENKYTTSKLANKIKILPHFETQEQIADIMRQADVGVFPYRAEGWCMPALEMMACGKEIIATYYSGPTEYLDPEVTTCISTINKELEPAHDGKWFFGQGNWLKLDEKYVDTLSNSMIIHHDNKQKNGAKINDAHIEISQKFSWSNTATKIISALS